MQQASLFETIEFDTDGICGFPELSLEVAEVRAGAVVEEEFYQQLDAGAGGDEGIEHLSMKDE